MVYLFAFWSLAQQVDGLIGRSGILPAADFMSTARTWADSGGLGLERFLMLPTVCWFSTSDGFLYGLTLAGVVLSLAQMCGVLAPLVLPALWLLYLSLTVVAQDFLGFQWDGLLLETSLVAITVTPLRWIHRWRDGAEPSPIGRWLVWWLLFRLMFASGFVKLASGDPSWRDLTALAVHYETQPLPTPIAWYMAQLPLWLHRISTVMVFAIELGVPWLIAAGVRARRVAAVLLIGLQLLIALTGNYAFFNLLSAALCITLLDDRVFGRLVSSGRSRQTPAVGRIQLAIAVASAIVIVPVSTGMFARQLGLVAASPAQRLEALVDPFRSVNNYGLFAVMTRTRPEIVVEGSADGTTWRTYEFRDKPGALSHRPGWVAPFQPRLDWQMWFAALGTPEDEGWYKRFVLRLLQGAPPVTRLLAVDPFAGAPPRFVRSTLYQYRYAAAGHGDWWVREKIGDYGPVLTLNTVK